MLFACTKPDLGDTNGPDDPDVPNPLANYWENCTDIVSMRLQGKVKKIVTDTDYMEFDQAGNIVKSGSLDNPNDYNTRTFDSKNRLTKEVSKYGGSEYVYEYFYENDDKLFVPEQWHHLSATRLVPGLSKYVASGEREQESVTLYKFENGKLNIYSEVWNEEKQTLEMGVVRTIEYEGGYPVKMEHREDMNGAESLEYFESTYYPNGMFKEITEGRSNSGQFSSSDIHRFYYKDHQAYLLLDRMENDVREPYFVGIEQSTKERKSVTTYTEFWEDLESKEVTNHITDNITDTYSSIYEYSKRDKHNNFTEASFKMLLNGEVQNQYT